MYRLLQTGFAIIMSLAFTCSLHAQTDSTASRVRLVLVDGSELVGAVVSETADTIHFRTASMLDLRIPVSQVKLKETLQGQFIDGYQADRNNTRLLLGPTARPLKAGQGYFSAYEIFFPYVAVGLTDFLSLGAGITLFPGADAQAFYFAPKVVPLQTENFWLGGGVLYANSTSGGDGAGIYYGVATVGSDRAAFTFGAGWGFTGDEVADKPVLTLGGEIRTSRTVKLISENWIPVGGETAVLSLGVRLFGENIAADFGLFYVTSFDEGFPLLPWLGFAYNFGGD